MERVDMITDGGNNQLVADPIHFPRSYQLEALEKALKQNTIVFFETGTGKTLIAIMLLKSNAHLLRNPSPYIAVFLVPTVVLVTQQGEAVAMHTDLKVGKYYGELGVDFWDAATWEREKNEHEVLVMTPQILLDALRRMFIRLDQIKVLIFDECHNARGKHPYACIMTEIYHRQLASNNIPLPRIFGMTASPIKAKASNSSAAYWKQISELENLMNSKVYTCESVSVLARYTSFSTPKVKIYQHEGVPNETFKCLEDYMTKLVVKHKLSISSSTISVSVAESANKRLDKLFNILKFCLSELGIWLAMKAADVYSREEEDIFAWGKMDVSGERVVRSFSLDAAKVFSASMPSGSERLMRHHLEANMTAGYLSSKVMCLVDTLLEYRHVKDLRCIVFVERIVTAIAISSLLNELLPEFTGWRSEYTAGNSSRLQSQSRKEQNAIVDEFRKGTVNIIVSTSMLEEGLDVQSCNLVIRFDPSATICSFIQSRGRARMQNSEFILMVKSGDTSGLARVENYLSSGSLMRRECLSHANLPCKPLDNEMYGEPWYQVESTGAIVTLSSSVNLLYFYCSRLPSDGYFKPYPRCTIDKDLEICTLLLPNSSPIQSIIVQGNTKILKQLACLEACKKLHQVGALTDNLVPDIVEEEAEVQNFGNEPYLDDHTKYFPPELVSSCSKGSSDKPYHFYLVKLEPNFRYDVKLQNVVLAVHERLDIDSETLDLDLDSDRGNILVGLKYIGQHELTSDQVVLSRRFQITLFRALIDHNFNKLNEDLDELSKMRSGSLVFDYLLLPSLRINQNILIDWKCIRSILYTSNASLDEHKDCFLSRGYGHYVHTKNGLMCCCMLENSLVCTPHNGVLYCINGSLDGFDEPSNSSYELPPELCEIIMSPISISTIYSFSFLPSIMHRIESLLIASNLKSMVVKQNVHIPTLAVLEAITTKKCQEKIHLESLETLGDSFLKYAATQQLFQTYQNQHEGLLSVKREKIICNATLCKLGCEREITGFIRDEPFEPKEWIIPGANCGKYITEKENLSSKKFYCGANRKLKSKTIADVVEALIGAFLSTGGESAALSFMEWLGIKVVFESIPYTRGFSVNPELHVNIQSMKSLLNYSFRDVSLLVEAITHGSYMLPEIPRCYQRLEFLGDAALDYLITMHLYRKYPGLSPGLLTDLRSSSVNNDCYAQSAIKMGLYKHILHTSPELHRQIIDTVSRFDELSSNSTFDWDSETTFPKVLGDVIESLAGAILVDSGYNKDVVFDSIRPLLEPMISPETMRLHPVRELSELCQKENFIFKKPIVSNQKGVAYVTVEVEANGFVHKESCSGADKKTAKRLACWTDDGIDLDSDSEQIQSILKYKQGEPYSPVSASAAGFRILKMDHIAIENPLNLPCSRPCRRLGSNPRPSRSAARPGRRFAGLGTSGEGLGTDGCGVQDWGSWGGGLGVVGVGG
ncbi:hypothetical protein RD792_003635 [Penstemon davidsonii]|uniref:Uncharacterized protein n=1 Tax=Penstemon davidsonii TaxID=160366 RepID=A0ABR0DFB1_9LAMI|nr:hypothetical protein RD792_003635 [Penstemon davidsonii]